ncbi:MAG: HAMP domain-containing histidine kinase [Verrucomicrobia bacterium]|nr:HAMP domain-containing histidine kinase [Verrucomicrobiota bacterium]
MMKVSYPLSLKVSLWLVLNLLLLAGLGLGFFIVQGGLGWDALVAGPTGDRAQALFNVISGEAAAADTEERGAVLQRFGTAYGAEFFLLSPVESRQVGNLSALPSEVKERLEWRGPGWSFPGRSFGLSRDGRRAFEGESGARRREPPDLSSERFDRPPPEPPDRGRFTPDGGRRGEPSFGFPPPDRRLGRFLVRSAEPAAYWVGMRVLFAPADRSVRALPAALVARVDSLWSLLHLLGLQAWLLAGSGVLALSVVFWLPLVRSITGSIAQLTTATEQIAEGRFETRVDASRRDEIGRLGESVNRMAQRLDTHMTGQRRFLGDVAHELCSPLARLQMATGILSEQAPPALQATVADVREEVQQMSALVNELLAFTKAGLQPREIPLTTLELDPLVRATVEREGGTDRVSVVLPTGVLVRADADLLRRALGNLIRNALRYAGTAGPVTISAECVDQRLILAVEDEGPGVPPADLDRLGEPFFRPEMARTRESGGVGLGLAIVRTSMAACQGEVRFANRSPRGFRAELHLRMA